MCLIINLMLHSTLFIWEMWTCPVVCTYLLLWKVSNIASCLQFLAVYLNSYHYLTIQQFCSEYLEYLLTWTGFYCSVGCLIRMLQKQEGKVSVIHCGVNVCSELSVDQQLKNLSISTVLDQAGFTWIFLKRIIKGTKLLPQWK